MPNLSNIVLDKVSSVSQKTPISLSSVQYNTLASELPMTGNVFGQKAFAQDTNRLYMWLGTGWYAIEFTPA